MSRSRALVVALACGAAAAACGAEVRLGDLIEPADTSDSSAADVVAPPTETGSDVVGAERAPETSTGDVVTDTSQPDVQSDAGDADVAGPDAPDVSDAGDGDATLVADASDASDANDARDTSDLDVSADAFDAADAADAACACKANPCVNSVCQPVVIATGQTTPNYLAADANEIFWTTSGHAGTLADPNVVAKVPKLGGTTVVLNADGGTAHGLAVSSTTVYWARGTTSSGTIHGASKLDGSANTIIGVVPTPPKFEGLVIDSFNIFVVDGTMIRAFSQSLTNHPGTTSTTSLTAGEGLALSLTTNLLYVADRGAGKVDEVGKFSNVTTPLASGLGAVVDVAVDATHVYFAAGTSVGRVNRSTLQVEGIRSGLTGVAGVAVNADSVYFTTATELHKSAKGTTTSQPLVTGLTQGGRLVLDDDYVYFADRGSATISRVPK